MKSHREMYPDQYNHSLCGQRVEVVTHGGPQTTGIVERVVSSRFGMLAILKGKDETAWSIADCKPLK